MIDDSIVPPIVRAARDFVAADDQARSSWRTADWRDWIAKRLELAQAVRDYDSAQQETSVLSGDLEHLCESPIEIAMFRALRFELPNMGAAIGRFGFFHPDHDDERNGVWISPQFVFGDYRVDFYIKIRCVSEFEHVVVECDGHDFHERTQQQAARDKSRDRWFKQRDIHVFRFSGSEIYRDPAGKAAEVSKFVLDRSIAIVSMLRRRDLKNAPGV